MKYIVSEKDKGRRLDVFLHSEILQDRSREFIKKLIKNDDIDINGKKVKAGQIINTGDTINVEIVESLRPDTISQDIPIEVIYEDEDIIIINKQRGMVVHPGSGNHDNTLVNAVMHHTNENLSSFNGPIRPGIVHRIDKDTSGLLVIAKNDAAHEKLAKQFKEHTIQKGYLAICEGQLEHNRIKIDKPISRNRIDRQKMAIDSEGKNAVSNIEVIERFKSSTYIKIEIETGRTHQIRIHMKSIGHPLIGDQKYGKKSSHISGQALHAYKLGLTHPRTGKYLEFKKEPPKDFIDLMDLLKEM